MQLNGDKEFDGSETLIEDPETDEDEIEFVTPSAGESLRYFGVDFDVEGLVRRFNRRELIVPRFNPPEEENKNTGYESFQRSFVWKKKQMDRFIESILLGYPVPGVFLVELESRQYIVLDGQQRLMTLRDFFDGSYSGPSGNLPFELKYVSTEGPFIGATYQTLSPSDQRLLNNALIQATIVVPAGDEGKMAVYSLFERINSGGTKLNDQQIRVAIYNGDVTKMIRDMNEDGSWRKLFGSPPHRDLKDQELILRYLALKDVALTLEGGGDGVEYKSPLASFMTQFLDTNDESLTADDRDQEMHEFSHACSLLVEAGGPTALRRNRTINAARADSILVGITTAIRANPALTVSDVSTALNVLENDDKFRLSTEKSTSHKRSVEDRLRASIDAFRDL